MIQLLSKWDENYEDHRFAAVKVALEAGLANTDKWYRTAKDTMIYFVTHGTLLTLLICLPSKTLVQFLILPGNSLFFKLPGLKAK
jgi:hypothetical protein